MISETETCISTRQNKAIFFNWVNALFAILAVLSSSGRVELLIEELPTFLPTHAFLITRMPCTTTIIQTLTKLIQNKLWAFFFFFFNLYAFGVFPTWKKKHDVDHWKLMPWKSIIGVKNCPIDGQFRRSNIQWFNLFVIFLCHFYILGEFLKWKNF